MNEYIGLISTIITMLISGLLFIKSLRTMPSEISKGRADLKEQLDTIDQHAETHDVDLSTKYKELLFEALDRWDKQNDKLDVMSVKIEELDVSIKQRDEIIESLRDALEIKNKEVFMLKEQMQDLSFGIEILSSQLAELNIIPKWSPKKFSNI